MERGARRCHEGLRTLTHRPSPAHPLQVRGAGSPEPADGEAARGLGGLPEGVVMEGAEFRRRVLTEDGGINAGGALGGLRVGL